MRSCLGGREVKFAAFYSTFFVAVLADLLMLAVLLFRAINMHPFPVVVLAVFSVGRVVAEVDAAPIDNRNLVPQPKQHPLFDPCANNTMFPHHGHTRRL